MNHGIPVGVGFSGRELAVRKVRKFQFEANFFDRAPSSVRTMTGAAGLFIEGSAVGGVGGGGRGTVNGDGEGETREIEA